jgi:xanthine dehydrogenase accessory factor
MIFSDAIQTCHDLHQAGISFAVVTMVKIDAHVPQEVGAKMIVTLDGLHSGTIGGGKIEAKGIALAIEQINTCSRAASMHRIDLNQDLGMVCGGVATLFIESVNLSSWTIAVYGAGHVGQALVNLLKTFSCQLVCVDSRPEWLDKLPDHPRLKKVLATDMATVPASLPRNTFHIIATPGHVIDLVVLREVLKLGSAPYIGVIGSKVKARTIRATLMTEGFSEDDTKRFFCPMGLPIGNNKPAEIAVSIAAQILEIRG